MRTKEQILDKMALYRVPGGGIGSWLTEATRNAVFERLGVIDEQPLPAVQLNQLLVLAHEAPVSDGFFRYYWLDSPKSHPYEVSPLPGFNVTWFNAKAIQSLDHLAWGLHRLYIDGLLYFGNVRSAFRALRNLSWSELRDFFAAKRVDTNAIKLRGPSLPLQSIDKDQRYLIAEVACKSYGEDAHVKSDLRSALTQAFDAHMSGNGGAITIGDLLKSHLPQHYEPVRNSLVFSASEILKREVSSQKDVDEQYRYLADRFTAARSKAVLNTEYYLSMLTDLDVYVATSMREPGHFVKMAQTCETLFSDQRLTELNLRFFDPTLSAADGHEDKGLIECLMVKCAKVLVYCAGERESYGKDAEAAMALSLGRPVIFLCEERALLYRDVHPLTRLIQFETGVAVGAIIANTIDEVGELLSRIFENRMVYRLEKSRTGSLRLIEDTTNSVVRIQTSNLLLTETFWNHYHQDKTRRPTSLVAEPVSQLRPIANDQPRPRPAQSKLEFEDTANAVRLAARSPVSDTPPIASGNDRAMVAPGPAQSPAPFPMTLAEIFEGISRIKRAQTTGARRFQVLSAWLETEGVSITEGLKLLRFIEATLEAIKVRPNFVYTHADLTRWYCEMSDGHVVGTDR